MSIIDKWHSLDDSNKFLIAYPFWFLLLFGVFYWGSYWSMSPIGQYLDTLQRDIIMSVLDSTLSNQIQNFDIVINPKYHVVITPECNGFVPYYIYLAGVLAYSCTLKRKVIYGVVGYFIFTVVNLIRLYVVTQIVNIYGADYFFWAHDIGGNLLLIITGMSIFWLYLKGCSKERYAK